MTEPRTIEVGMNGEPTPEQTALAAVLRDLLERRPPIAAIRGAEPGSDPLDRELWQTLATKIGVQGLLVPEELGGAGGDLLDVCAAFEELGRALVAGPYTASAVLATRLLLDASAVTPVPEWLEGLASGALVATAPFRAATQSLRIESGQASGVVVAVPFGDTADLLVLVDADDRLSVVPLRGDGIEVTAQRSIDPSQRMTAVHLTGASVHVLTAGAEACASWKEALDQARIALAAEQVGAGVRSVEAASAHATQRVQFGRPIGSFQSVKHRVVDAFCEVEYARTAVWGAAWAVVDGTATPLAVATAAAQASEALHLAASTSIQVHGGVAITWEHDAHWYLKRAAATKPMLGDPGAHYESIAAMLLDRP